MHHMHTLDRIPSAKKKRPSKTTFVLDEYSQLEQIPSLVVGGKPPGHVRPADAENGAESRRGGG